MTRYGRGVLFTFCGLALLVLLGTHLFIASHAIRFVIFSLTIILTGLVVNFFRDPERAVPDTSGIAVSPADGRIVQITSQFESEYLRAETTLVSIFMSPLDVHVNRIPVSGAVRYLKHTKGKFAPAFADKSSEVNERMSIGLESAGGERILMRQVAGTLARRIVAELEMNQQVLIGARFGMIRFGSRVDVFFPKSMEINVRLHQRVLAGESILATYRSNA